MAAVKRVVHDMSKDSSHFANESRKERAVESRILEMRDQYAGLSTAALAAVHDAVEKQVVRLEGGRDLTKTWIHVDMDAFYAAVHTLERPELAHVPMAVGGMSMICTANYEARKFGVRSAMPGFIARKLCPHLVFCATDFSKYRHYAGMTREVFRRYDVDFDAGSLDEAYLEVSAYMARTGMTPDAVAAEVRAAVREETGGLTCSAGVAPTRRLAKVCSDMNKPDGQKVVGADRTEVLALLASLPVRKIGGIGKVQERVLAAFGVTTCGDLLHERVLVAALFTPVAAAFMLEVAVGVGGERRPERAPEGAPQRKSLSQERTFAPTSDRRIIEAKLAALAAEVAAGLTAEHLRARVVAVKLKRATFEVVQRQAVLSSRTNDASVLTAAALRLLRGEAPTGPLRLLGFRASHFEAGAGADDTTLAGAGQIRIDTFLTTASSSSSANAAVGAGARTSAAGPSAEAAGQCDNTGSTREAGGLVPGWAEYSGGVLGEPYHPAAGVYLGGSETAAAEGPLAAATFDGASDTRKNTPGEEAVVAALDEEGYRVEGATGKPPGAQGEATGEWGSSTYLCLECGRNVPVAARAEHSDWHFARTLQREDSDVSTAARSNAGGVRGGGGRSGGGGGGGGGGALGKRGGRSGHSGGSSGGVVAGKSRQKLGRQTTLHSLLGPTKPSQ